MTVAELLAAVARIEDWQATVLAACYLLLGLAAGAHALLNKTEPRAAQVWLIICMAVPIVGAMAYYLFGINRIQTRARRLLEPAQPLTGGQSGLSTDNQMRHGRHLVIGDRVAAMAAREGNRVSLLQHGDAVYPAMLDAIAEAQREVLLCSYIFDNDEVGRRFVGALAEAQARGVSVRVLVDAIGECYSWPRISRELRRAELPSRRFLPPRFVPPFGYVNLRTHRKLLIVDGAIGFCGGLNIGDRHVTDASGYRPVDDAHFRMEGPVVTDLRTLFSDDWRFAAGEDLPRVPVCAVAGDMLCRVVPDGPNEDMDKLLFILHGALASARRYVYIMTPYFLPERDLVAALQTTALRGVDVRVVVPYRSNLRYVDWAMQHMLPTLLRSGVRVFRRRKFSHAKLLTVDGRYSLVGSANLDPRSLRLNFEVGVEIFDEGFARELELLMEQEMAAPEDTVASLFARGRTRRLRDACMALFTPYL